MDLAGDTLDLCGPTDLQELRAAIADRLRQLRRELLEAERGLAEHSVATRQLVHAAHDVDAAIAYLTQGGYVATLADGSAREREALAPSILKAARAERNAGGSSSSRSSR
jgi:hypothetical protein